VKVFVGMTRRIGTTLMAALALGVTACGMTARPLVAAPPIASAKWRSVISDWLTHHRFQDAHSCGAVVVARSRIAPAYREGSPVLHALDVYERSPCPAHGNVWAVKRGMSDTDVAMTAGAPIPWLSGPRCWEYDATKSGTSIDGARLCFANGRVTKIGFAVHL
jgi:hypothetical protein